METLNPLTLSIDILLGSSLLWLAWRALVCPDLFKAIVLFVAFGLLMALAWVRLDAIDVALAEAAIGAGLTGALLMAALAKLEPVASDEAGTERPDNRRAHFRFHTGLVISLLLLMVAGLVYVVLSLPKYATGLSIEVAANIGNSGVSNPVTAVLLNFRGYDTLLEMVVLFVALLGVWSLGEVSQYYETSPGSVLDSLTRLLIPLLILVSAYLLWIGAHQPGGAFQAGSVLGAAGVLLLLSCWRLRASLIGLPLRLTLLAGPAAFVAMAVFTLFIEGELLKYPKAQAGMLILILETLATLSIAATLATLFLGGRPRIKIKDAREAE